MGFMDGFIWIYMDLDLDLHGLIWYDIQYGANSLMWFDLIWYVAVGGFTICAMVKSWIANGWPRAPYHIPWVAYPIISSWYISAF
jgi:hypothetical protein